MDNNNRKIVYKLPDICKLLGMSYPTILGYVHTNKLKAVRIGGQWKVAKTELERFVNEGNMDFVMDFNDIHIDEPE